MNPFARHTSLHIECRAGEAREIGTRAPGLRGNRVAVISDPGLADLGVVEAADGTLRAAGCDSMALTPVAPDPPQASVKTSRAFGADCVVVLGGGSSFNSAQMVAPRCGTSQVLDGIFDIGLASGPRVWLTQIPTGTGSDLTPNAIVTTPEGEKKGMVSPLLLPDLALLDARLTMNLPPKGTAMTDVDAMKADHLQVNSLRETNLTDVREVYRGAL